MPHKTEIDPIGFTNELKSTFRRYLYTANMVSDTDPELQDHFWDELGAPDRIVKGPLINCIPAYEQGQTLQQIIASGGPPSVSSKLLKLPADKFDPSRPL